MSEADGADEIVGGALRVAATAAALVGERLAHARAERMRRAQQDSIAEARRLEAQLDGELAVARADLAVVEHDQWWNQAAPADVADAWQTAQQWRGTHPEVDRAAGRIRAEVRARYGVDVDDRSDLDPVTLDRAVAAREEALDAHARARRAGEALEAAVLLAADDQQRAAESANEVQRLDADPMAPHAGAAADLARQEGRGAPAARSPEVDVRQAELAKALAGVEDKEAVEARMVADLSQGRPARDAVTQPPRSAPKARRTRGAAVAPRQQQRGISR